MSWQHLNQSWGWKGVILLSRAAFSRWGRRGIEPGLSASSLVTYILGEKGPFQRKVQGTVVNINDRRPVEIVLYCLCILKRT